MLSNFSKPIDVTANNTNIDVVEEWGKKQKQQKHLKPKTFRIFPHEPNLLKTSKSDNLLEKCTTINVNDNKKNDIKLLLESSLVNCSISGIDKKSYKIDKIRNLTSTPFN